MRPPHKNKLCKNIIMNNRLAIILGIALFAISLASCQRFEQPHRYFDSYSEELHDGNWVPNIFPKDISQINEQHDLDTNEVWLSYTPGKIDFDPLKMGMVSLETKEIEKLEFRAPYQAYWWFEGPIQKQPSNDNALNSVIFGSLS